MTPAQYVASGGAIPIALELNSASTGGLVDAVASICTVVRLRKLN